MKRKTIFLRNLLLAVTVLTFLMGVQMSSYVAAAEATSYIPTWKEYTESGQPSATWNDVANAMDALLDAGKAIYASGDADGARKNVNDAYYGYYETTGFERQTMGFIGGGQPDGAAV